MGLVRKANMSNKIKIIKTEEDYKNALDLIKELMNQDPDPDSEEGEQLNILAALVKDYESVAFPESAPDPIDAILFRMEQQHLKPRDLIPYVGSRSKVSEILSRKRPLTLSMMRALETGLGIPAKVLLKEPDDFRNEEDIAWNLFPLKEMEKRGYFGDNSLSNTNLKTLMEKFLNPLGSPAQFVGMLRKSYYIRSIRSMDKQALVAWSAYIIKEANKIKFSTIYKKKSVDLAFMQKVAKLSVETNGPILAQNLLRENGIALIIEPHFPQTYLDGASIMTNEDHPIIALTLRYDRLDNFWFTLMHELAHLVLHFEDNINLFYDDLDRSDSTNAQETEADRLAGEALVPKSKWENSPAKIIPSPIAAESLARELGIHIVIVAGKMRYEGENYQYLNTIVNHERVRKYFTSINWNK